jgi:hypothetical protein
MCAEVTLATLRAGARAGEVAHYRRPSLGTALAGRTGRDMVGREGLGTF